jgi:hypothetical protein
MANGTQEPAIKAFTLLDPLIPASCKDVRERQPGRRSPRCQSGCERPPMPNAHVGEAVVHERLPYRDGTPNQSAAAFSQPIVMHRQRCRPALLGGLPTNRRRVDGRSTTMNIEPKVNICLDCGLTVIAEDGITRTRCLGCWQRYDVQIFLLKQFLARTH